MASFNNPGGLKFKHAVTSELRVRVEGPRPGNMAKVVLTDDVGTRLTAGILHSWSDRSVELLRELLESIAQDMVDALEEAQPSPGFQDSSSRRYIPDHQDDDSYDDDDDPMNLGYRE